MADTVSTQITDAVTQANVKVLGDSPAMAMSNLYQTMSQSLSLSAQNAVTAQQQSNIVHQAATTQGVSLLYSVDTASMAAATSKAMGADTADLLANILAVALALKDINKPSAPPAT
ncbi:RebB family R body protein [Aphanothece sacrum]|uniref:Glycerol-3-phosphate dehydrogenase subunit C n=1 Tax=Aphanothece sacrum FPU1 TaxID=1920663 RepID=A0A401ILI8_APHSA|nr:RebB family R body protein [Aphanothece sacrum]GBF82101.1 glycerol-3-phosphate dehydrogenase subunit C [Aphanothece sacrum FPU1]GBF85035.1 glycerol-3-phosphate dehydrogenase subunit C [Aphanothece sacrum FPU3]